MIISTFWFLHIFAPGCLNWLFATWKLDSLSTTVYISPLACTRKLQKYDEKKQNFVCLATASPFSTPEVLYWVRQYYFGAPKYVFSTTKPVFDVPKLTVKTSQHETSSCICCRWNSAAGVYSVLLENLLHTQLNEFALKESPQKFLWEKGVGTRSSLGSFLLVSASSELI